MRWLIFFVCLSLSINELSLAQTKVQLPTTFQDPLLKELKPFFAVSEGQTEELLKGGVISSGHVTSPTEKEQQMMLFVSGIHQRNCTRAMRKLSLYENYHNYMDFIKESKYDEKTQKFSFTVEHTLLPFPMIVAFKIPRITKEGHYPFVFEDGFLKDLRGTVIVKELGKFCILGMKTDWRGPESKIPNVIFETFIETVAKLELEHLIRVSYF